MDILAPRGINASISAFPIPSVPPVITITLSLKDDMWNNCKSKNSRVECAKKFHLRFCLRNISLKFGAICFWLIFALLFKTKDDSVAQLVEHPDFYREGHWKNEKKFDSVAQLVEQYTFNVWVLGSSPSGITS